MEATCPDDVVVLVDDVVAPDDDIISKLLSNCTDELTGGWTCDDEHVLLTD